MTDKRARTGRRGLLLLLLGVVVAGGLAAQGIWSRSETVAALQKNR